MRILETSDIGHESDNIKSRIKVYEEDIIYYTEFENPDNSIRNEVFDELERVIPDRPYFIIFDSREMKTRENARERELLVKRLNDLPQSVCLFYLFNEKSYFDKTLKFILKRTKHLSYWITKTPEEAFDNIKSIKDNVENYFYMTK